MTTKKDGGQAFPATETHPSWDFPVQHPGMSLRDWFAGQALHVSMLGADAVARTQVDASPMALAATAAYAMADAMLAERSK